MKKIKSGLNPDFALGFWQNVSKSSPLLRSARKSVLAVLQRIRLRFFCSQALYWRGFRPFSSKPNAKSGFNLFFIAILISFIVGDKICLSQELKRFNFDRKDALSGWREKIFHGRVSYTIEDDGETKRLVAKSDKTSSGLFYPIKFNPNKYPYLSWRWKVRKFPSKQVTNDITKKSWIERDDYAVRVYVIFPTFIFTNTKCIEYIWAERLPKGAILTSPFFKNIKLIVLQSGNEKIDEWLTEERNIVEDYKAAFNRAPSVNVGAIALMTDSDNTQSSAEGCYSDIRVGYERAIGNEDANNLGVEDTQGFFGYLKYLMRKYLTGK